MRTMTTQEAVKAALFEHHITPYRLAKTLYVSAPSVHNWRDGKARMSKNIAVRFKLSFNIEVSDAYDTGRLSAQKALDT